ncbi:hypothetical protein C8F04DRAFT_1267686 [Mycena alexandri]|uniref:Amidase domain-containing protein n=1 Tax=Mycena alexandri TaxID=1745969 RepID=A0AAD6SJQ3_9AGAR|nr:hypothetical protein C8F04DRAFT_1267686 [Mycena alexandri]
MDEWCLRLPRARRPLGDGFCSRGRKTPTTTITAFESTFGTWNMIVYRWWFALTLCFPSNVFGFGRGGRPPPLPDLYEVSVPGLQAGLDGGQFTSVDVKVRPPHSRPSGPVFTKALNRNTLKGKRIGAPQRGCLNDSITRNHPSAFEKALLTIEALGATVVDPAELPSAEELVTSKNDMIVLAVQLSAYFEALLKKPSGVRSLADSIKFNDDNPIIHYRFIASEATNGFDAAYFAALAADHDLGSTHGIDFVLKKFNLDALVLPAPGFASFSNVNFLKSRPPAVVGYPILTVPLGSFLDNVT